MTIYDVIYLFPVFVYYKAHAKMTRPVFFYKNRSDENYWNENNVCLKNQIVFTHLHASQHKLW